MQRHTSRGVIRMAAKTLRQHVAASNNPFIKNVNKELLS